MNSSNNDYRVPACAVRRLCAVEVAPPCSLGHPAPPDRGRRLRDSVAATTQAVVWPFPGAFGHSTRIWRVWALDPNLAEHMITTNSLLLRITTATGYLCNILQILWCVCDVAVLMHSDHHSDEVFV